MEFLGKLGVDIKLLIAQLINFGLLLWLLAKFVYKPIIRRIEKDENELKQAQTKKTELDKEKEEFLENKKKEAAEINQRAREIIREAEEMAEKITQQTSARARQDAENLIAEARKEAESQKAIIEKEVAKTLKIKTVENFQSSFENSFSSALQKELQNVFWLDFIAKLKAARFKKIDKSYLIDILEKEKRKKMLGKELKEAFSQKIGPVILEYIYPLGKEKEKELKDAVFGKIGFEVAISQKQNKSLINGFRLEIMGTIIESNLLQLINNATSFE